MRADEFSLKHGVPFEASNWSLDSGEASEGESHPEHEVWLVVAGTIEARSGDDHQRVAAGGAIYFQPFQPHQAINIGTDPCSVVSVYWLDGEDGDQQPKIQSDFVG